MLQVLKRTEVYGNWTMLSPEGVVMCKCAEKKARWYMSRNLAKLVPDQEKTFQLFFAPKGHGNAGDEYYLSNRESMCCVCGVTKNLTRHHVVPYGYRRHLPLEYKSRSSHDIMTLCDTCHTRYHMDYGDTFVDVIDAEFGVDVTKPRPLRETREPSAWIEMAAGKAASTLLKHSDKIPENRRAVLWADVHAHFGPEITQEDLEEIVVPLKEQRKGRGKTLTRGYYVAKKIEADGRVHEFYTRWRQQFLDTMQPKFLPKGWQADKAMPKIDAPTQS